jgi:nucleotide-binding universal stress UspA family protein
MNALIQSVLHPTDFSEGSRVAFYHALGAALVASSELTLLNISPDRSTRWSDFPGVRETLENWGLLPAGSPRSAVGQLGLDVKKVIGGGRDPVDGVLQHLRKHPADLIVLATHQNKGMVQWLGRSVAEPIARRAGEMALFIPGNNAGFVGADGSIALSRILVPIAQTPRAQPALEAAARIAAGLRQNNGTFTLLHVGEQSSMPSVDFPDLPGWTWEKEVRSGDVIQTILDTAESIDADLIVMATDGRNGFLDGLRGSHSERVLRHASAPLLTVPAGSYASDVLG